MLIIDGVETIAPSSFHWDIEPHYTEDSGRTLDDVMHLDYIDSKRKLSCAWNGITWAQASTLLKMVPPERFIQVRYPDLKSGTYETRMFYTGPQGADAAMWTAGKKIINAVSFNIIEK